MRDLFLFSKIGECVFKPGYNEPMLEEFDVILHIFFANDIVDQKNCMD